jgi:hypothetical protein
MLRVGDLVRYHQYFGIVINPSGGEISIKHKVEILLGNGLVMKIEPGGLTVIKLPNSQATQNFHEAIKN